MFEFVKPGDVVILKVDPDRVSQRDMARIVGAYKSLKATAVVVGVLRHEPPIQGFIVLRREK